MTGLPSVPPGRAGRLWLRGRLATAERALGLLDRKLRALRTLRDRLQAAAADSAAEWARTCAEAETWQLRAALLGGTRAFRLATPREPATVTITHEVVMGVRHPSAATVSTPADPLPPGAALIRARQAHEAALTAAARHAAATEAVRVVDREVALTAQRVRAIRNRWIPALRTALAEVDRALEEMEHADAVRLRRRESSRSRANAPSAAESPRRS